MSRSARFCGLKKKKQKARRATITEPTRTSIYDILVKNLQLAGRVVYVHRLIYIGEHSFAHDAIPVAFRENIRSTNSGYCTDPLTGVLLHYDKFFCHIVEANEEVLMKHLRLFFEAELSVKNTKVLSTVHHITARFSDVWMHYYGRPPVRVEEIDPESDLENSMRYVKNCGEKLYNFARAYLVDFNKSMSNSCGSSTYSYNIGNPRTSTGGRDIYSEHLPEPKLLTFLVNCKHTLNLLDYYNFYGKIYEAPNFNDKAWPTQPIFAPYNIFDKPFDPITDLPQSFDEKPKEVEIDFDELEEGNPDVVETT